jgi:elongation factor P
MASLGMNDVKTGQKILVNNDPASSPKPNTSSPARARRSQIRIKFRNIKSGRGGRDRP